MTGKSVSGALGALMVGTLVTSAWLAPGRADDRSAGAPSRNQATAHPRSEAAPIGRPPLLSPHANPVVVSGGRVFVANTPSDTVDVFDADTGTLVKRVTVGVDPVGLAVRPDGSEVWVANHVSDSVSVIDADAASPTFLYVLATVQDLDPATRATRFDEPVGVAFASDTKAYVALSSENRVAVVDVGARRVTAHLDIPAQDPRAIAVRGGRLYVAPFESNNRSQLSGGYDIDGELVTFNAHEHSVANNNVLSIGHVLDIVKHPEVPDRDLFVFDTETDELIEVVDSLGTLLYGLAVGSGGEVFVAQTDARNDANGRSGTAKHGLDELENRPFLNQITRVRTGGGAGSTEREFIDLEPLPPAHPAPGEALATPFGIAVSPDDSALFVTAAGSDRLFTVDPGSGQVLGRVAVGAVPRGVALENDPRTGQPVRAWVLNAVENSVSVVDARDPAALREVARLPLADPTHPAFKRGRIAFNAAAASSTSTFSCASCHPDAHTDQLLWVLKTPVVTGGDQIMPRSTMPIRGLRDTAPFHWDGIPGDPYGGNNSANVYGHSDPNCDPDDPESAARHLIDAGLASTMLLAGDDTENDEGKAGRLSRAERDDLAKFLLGVSYPPAQRRAYTNELSERARSGFDLFHIKGHLEGRPRPNVCGDCHRMPFLVSTNTPGTGMDAPTWRGAYDRFLILPQGRLNIIDFDFYRNVAERGAPEREVWQFSWQGQERFDPVWDMVLEGSTGFSGAFGRQVTLDHSTGDELTSDLIGALETAAREGAVVLQVDGVLLDGATGAEPVTLQFQPGAGGSGVYAEKNGVLPPVPSDRLFELARGRRFVGTFTGWHPQHADFDHPQPAIWTRGELHAQAGRQEFPVLFGERRRVEVSGRHIRDGAWPVVNGRRVGGVVRLEDAEMEHVTVELASLPEPGLHFLQVQNPGGLFSNDFIFHVAEDEAHARAVKSETNPDRAIDALAEAIARGDEPAVRRLLDRGAPLDAQRQQGGMTPLSTAVFHGRPAFVRLLLDRGADVSGANEDGNTALHLAAFFCRDAIVDLLVEAGAELGRENNRGETPADTVEGEWSDGLAGFYTALSEGAGLGLDLEEIREQRPEMARHLGEFQRLAGELIAAVSDGERTLVSQLVDAGAPVGSRDGESGMTPLATAAFHGHHDVAEELIARGADVNRANRDGNAPLHIAAFLCRERVVDLLVEHGASLNARNDRGESPVDVVSGAWSDGLAGFYAAIADGAGFELDHAKLERLRPEIAERLRGEARRRALPAPATTAP